MALDFGAGCLGGCSGVLVGHPFDTVKVRLQTQSSANPLYRGTFDCFRNIVRKESLLGLYKGMASPLYGLAAINAIVFGVQANVTRRLADPDSLASHCFAGAIAGLAQSVICSPMELAKTRMQIQGQGESRTFYKSHRHSYTGPVDCLKKIYHVEGVRGVFRGFGLTVARETPSFGVYFASYEWICRHFRPDDASGDEIGTLALLFAGGMAGICAWLVTYPVDVIKSRVQADMAHNYKGFLDCAAKSYAEEGIHAFTKGLASTLLRAFPVNAATFTTVAYTLRLAKADKPDEDGSFDLHEYVQKHYPGETRVHLDILQNFPSQP